VICRLRALNGVSLIFALIANVSLFLNMAGRVTFNITQPITIAGFWIASILLIALVALVAHESHEKGVSSSSKTQAYYYCIIAAGIYQIISYAMCITLYGAYKGHYRKEFRLEKHQRALMLQTVVFLSYLLLGALIYSKLEGWEFLDAVYWADFTLLTIGIGGEFSPSTHEGRSLLFPFAFGGIVALGLIVESINNLGLDKTRRKLTRERIEKRRQRASKGTLVFRNMSKVKGQKIKTDSPTRATVCAPGIASRDGNESSRHEAEFDAIRRMQSFKTQRLEWIRLAISVFVVAILWFLGALVFWATEKTQDWSYFEALYFSYTTLMTIGYGDFQPETESSKPFFVFWTMLAVPTLTILVSHLRGTLFKGFKDLAIWIYRILTASTGYLQSFACSRFLTALESVPMGVQNCVRTENGQISHLEAIDSTVNDVEKSGETGQQQRGRHIHPTAESKLDSGALPAMRILNSA
jgi:potassium channel subfamily K